MTIENDSIKLQTIDWTAADAAFKQMQSSYLDWCIALADISSDDAQREIAARYGISQSAVAQAITIGRSDPKLISTLITWTQYSSYLIAAAHKRHGKPVLEWALKQTEPPKRDDIKQFIAGLDMDAWNPEAARQLAKGAVSPVRSRAARVIPDDIEEMRTEAARQLELAKKERAEAESKLIVAEEKLEVGTTVEARSPIEVQVLKAKAEKDIAAKMAEVDSDIAKMMIESGAQALRIIQDAEEESEKIIADAEEQARKIIAEAFEVVPVDEVTEVTDKAVEAINAKHKKKVTRKRKVVDDLQQYECVEHGVFYNQRPSEKDAGVVACLQCKAGGAA
jgi:vacuolar-type H+-ATPase subunit H